MKSSKETKPERKCIERSFHGPNQPYTGTNLNENCSYLFVR